MRAPNVSPLSLRSGGGLMLGALGAALCFSPAHAQAPSSDRSVPSVTDIADPIFSGKRSRDVLAVQVMLDRASFSPGEIDGFAGGNTSRAIKGWQRANGMAETGQVDQALLKALRGGQGMSVVEQYQVGKDDLAGPFGPLPEGMEALSRLDTPHYESAVEALAERFHMSPKLLRALNPNIDSIAAGDRILVAAVETAPLDGKVTRIEIDSASASLNAYGADDRLLASYPATVGSSDFPSPSGAMEVRALAPEPAYYFSPEGRDWGPDKKLKIAPGPNNPVGSTWIDLTKEGYGIHGTPDPKLIGKTASHGCVRLTNWDAQELGAAVEKGTKVTFL